MAGWPFSFRIASEKATSRAVSGEPSWKRASGRAGSGRSARRRSTRTRARDEPVERVRLVAARRAIRLSKVAVHAGRAVALQHVDVQRVEGVEVLVADRLRIWIAQSAALRRVRPDVVEMREVGRVFQVAEDRQAVGFGLARALRESRRRGRRARPRRRAAGEDRRGASASSRRPGLARPSRRRTTRSSGTRRRRIRAASAGRPKRSQRAVRCSQRGSIAARRSRAPAARGRAPWWRPPAPRGPWRR